MADLIDHAVRVTPDVLTVCCVAGGVLVLLDALFGDDL